ncbi:MAG: ATP-binding protein [Bacteroidota bacterium]
MQVREFIIKYCKKLPVAFLFLPFALLGQHLNFQHFTAEDGFIDQASFELKMTQDRSGFMWLPNLNGLYRYDGKEFKLFKKTPGDTDGLSTNTIRIVHEASDGKIWVGTGNGIHIYDPQTGKFEHLRQDPDDEESLCGNDVRSIGEDKDGNIWVGALNWNVCVCDPKERKFKRKYYPVGELHYLQQRDGTIWHSGINGLFKYLPAQDTFQRFINIDETGGKSSYGASVVFEYEDGNLWYTSRRSEMGIFNPATSAFSAFPDVITNHFSSISPSAILRDQNGIIWLAGYGEVLKYDPIKNSSQLFPHLPEEPSSCQAGSITSMFEDRAGSIWISAHSGRGLSVVHSPNTPFEQLPLFKDPATIFHWENNQLAAFNVSGVTKTLYDLKDGTIEPLKGISPYFENWSLWLWLDNNNILWWLHGDTKTTRGVNLKTGKQYLIDEYKWLKPDSKSNLWYAKPAYYDIAKDSLINYQDKILQVDSSEARRKESYNYVLVDSKDRVWLNGSLGGLVRYDKSKDEVKIFSPDHNDPNSVVGGPSNLIFEGSNGWIYIITSDGTSIYQEEHDRFINLDLSDGLSQSIQIPAVEDDQQNIWLGLSKGLCRINSQNFDIQFFDETYGLPPGVYERSMIKDEQGRIYFIKGYQLYRFHPELLQPDTTAYPIVFTDFYVNRKLVAPGVDNPILKKTIEYTGQLVLEHTQSDFGFRFVSPDFKKGKKLEYFYQLENYDKDWVSIGNDVEVHLTSIPKGHYRFKVKAKTPSGHWTPVHRGIAVQVLPAWWETWWFYLACILLIAGLVFTWIHRLRTEVNRATKKIREDKAIIERQAARLQELDEAKSKFFTNISHEFRTPLTIISGMIDNIQSKPDTWLEKGGKIIKQNSLNLLNLINQILDLRKLQSQNLKLNLMQGDIIEYLHFINESYKSYAENEGLQLHFLPFEEQIIMDYDPDKILRIVSNLLSNAIKYNRPDGKIYFQMEKIVDESNSNQFLRIQVKDTGPGIPQNKLKDIFDRFYQINEPGEKKVVGSGIGLALTYELIQLMKGEIKVDSEENVGTTFIVQLPISKTSQQSSPFSVVENPKIGEELTSAFHAKADVESSFSATDNDSSLPKLLIVEDNPQIVQVLIASLEDHFQLEIASNGLIGIQKGIEQIPDIIVSDVMMPEKDGLELTATLKTDERTDHIPIILLTAKSDIESKIQGLEKGADAYMPKPFEKRELLARIHNLLELRKKLQERYSSFSDLPKKEKVEDPFLHKFYNLVEKHLADPDLDMHKINRTLGMSRTQVFRKLKALTGKSPTALIRSYRLQKGKELLATSDLSISEVAYEVGFTSLNYFSAAFFEEFGERPSATRK